MLECDGLRLCVLVERLKSLLAPKAGPLVAAERQLDSSASSIVIDEYLPGSYLSAQIVGSVQVTSPDGCYQAKRSSVSQFNRLFYRREGSH